MKLFILLFLALLSGSTFAQVKHLVFNIEGTLVQGIPERNYNSFQNKDQMIAVNVNGRKRYYYIYPNAGHLLNYFQKRDEFVIHFATDQDESWARTILEAINLPKPIQASVASYLANNAVSKLLTSKDMVTGRFNLRQLTSDLSNVILITAKKDLALDTQRSNEFFIGNNFYYFETFDQAQSERGRVDSSERHNFPESEEEWSTEQNKMAYIFQVMKEANASATADLVKSLRSVPENPVQQTIQGLRVARFKFEEKILLFKFNAHKTVVTGCGLFDSATDRLLENRPLDQCLKIYATKHVFKLDERSKKVVGCELVDEAHKASISVSLNLGSCLKSAAVKYYWQGEKRVTCGMYHDDYFIQAADESNCNNAHLVMVNGKTEIRYYFEVDGKLTTMVPEIVDLGPWDTILDDTYNKYDVQILALSLINRLRILKKETGEGEADYDFMRDTRVVMAFNYKYLSSIATGGFLNQHQTGSSGGILNLARRNKAENGFMQLNLESSYGATGGKAHQLRPKYSYLMLDKYRKDMGLNNIYTHYGNVYAVFKEEIKQKSTFTPGDSLDSSADYDDIRTFWYRSSKILKVASSNEYFETQIWGGLNIEDVDHFLVNCTETLNSDQIAELKKLRPVYECNASWENGASRPYNLTKGSQL